MQQDRFADPCRTNEQNYILIEAGVDLLEVQKILGHHSILTTSRYTHLTSHTTEKCGECINALMDRFNLGWGAVL